MTVRRHENGTIILDGNCGVEDAEPLLQMLLATPGVPVDWRPSRRLHTAVVQVILLARPAVLGPCGDEWIEKWAPSDRSGQEPAAAGAEARDGRPAGASARNLPYNHE